jgi:hypothetical protein
MKITLQRETFTDTSTMGEMFLEDGSFKCFTLELPSKDGMPGSCIPPGEYPVWIEHSPRFARDMLHLQDIPNRSSILIHWGNVPDDTEGCILVGDVKEINAVGASRMAFDALWGKVYDAARNKQLTIEVIGGAKQPIPDSSWPNG